MITPVDRKRVNTCIPKNLFWEGVEQQKIAKKKLKCSALLMSRFQNLRLAEFCGWHCNFFETLHCAVVLNFLAHGTVNRVGYPNGGLGQGIIMVVQSARIADFGGNSTPLPSSGSSQQINQFQMQ